MQKLSPLMKGLVETRARADGDYQHALATLNHRTQYAHSIQQTFKAKLNKASHAISLAQSQADAALQTRNACDNLISKLNSKIQTTQIESIHAWKDRYGPRNILSQTLLKVLHDAYPEAISTTLISQAVQSTFGLVFETPLERQQWVRASIRARLGYLCKIGIVERLHQAQGNTLGLWRSRPPNTVTPDIRTLATQAGLTTTFALDQDSLETDYLTCEPTPEEDDIPR